MEVVPDGPADPNPSSSSSGIGTGTRTGLCCCRKPLRVPGRARPTETPRPARPAPNTCRHHVDVASASNFRSFRLSHFHLDLRLSFPLKEVTGRQLLDLVPVRPGVHTLVLDSHPSLLIHSVDLRDPGPGGGPGVSLTFRLDPFTDYGSSLTVSLPPALVQRGVGFQLTVRFTSTDGPAMWWLDPPLTCGRLQPLVFTLGHSVSNRSFFPCFDTPAVKSTYSATVRVPEGVMVLMSATSSSYSKLERVFHFSMQQPVPVYLVALVAGKLQHADLGPRSRVWAEPCLLPCVVNKLGSSVERWLGLAEDLFGPYPWGRCDIVFLPPSFPIVAMENPCLTFIIASILESRDFLLIDIIHEIAHGWFGNAVTGATWEHMWLSEGLATYAQRRITTLAYGEAFTCLETQFRLDALHRQLRLLGDDTPVSKLQVKFEPGVNPSTLMNLFTYEKGFCFASYLSTLCGDVSTFDAFLRAYINQFKFSSVVAEDLIELFLDYFPELKEEGVAYREGLEFERWLCGAGPPLFEPDLSAGSILTRPVHQLCDLWAGHTPNSNALATFDLSTWSSFQIVLFLDRMLDRCPLAHEVMEGLSSSYSQLLSSLSAEVHIRWLQMVVRSTFHPGVPAVRGFLHKHTSRMYTVPLYEDLVAGVMKCVAMEIYYQTQGRLHPNLRHTLQQIIFQSSNPTPSPPDPAPSHPAPAPSPPDPAHSPPDPAPSHPDPAPSPPDPAHSPPAPAHSPPAPAPSHSNYAPSAPPNPAPSPNPSTSSPSSPQTNSSLPTPSAPPETNTSSSFPSPPPQANISISSPPPPQAKSSLPTPPSPPQTPTSSSSSSPSPPHHCCLDAVEGVCLNTEAPPSSHWPRPQERLHDMRSRDGRVKDCSLSLC